MSEETTGFDDLLFDIRRSVRYHDRRQGFYQGVQNLALLLAFLFGTATVATFGAAIGKDLPVWVRLLPALATSMLTGIALVYRVAEKAWLHQDLKREFIGLEIRLELSRDEASDELIAHVQADRLAVEAREPKVLRVLDTLCYNDVMRATGSKKKQLIEVGSFQRACAHLFDFREHTLHAKD